MKKQDKIFEVENLSAKVKDAKSIALADFKGLSVSQATDLRNRIKEAGGDLQVVKNNLFYRALLANKYKVDKSKFEGTNMALFANEDEIAPLKVLAGFAKTSNLLPFRFGFMTGQFLTAEELVRFASLPGKKELQAKLVGMLANQPRRLVLALNSNIQKLVLALSAIQAKKQ